jgi:hypothetical protein
VLVASAKSSSRRALQRTVQVLGQVDAAVVGTVLNRADTVESYGGGYGYPTATTANGNGASRRLGRKPPAGRVTS